MRRWLAAVLPVLSVLAVLGVGTPAQAYGTDHLYQLTFSLNCNNRSSDLCSSKGFGLGGLWGWIELDGKSRSATSGEADGEVTFCSHSSGQQGAFHMKLDEAPWFEADASELPKGVETIGTDPNGEYLVVPDVGLAFPETSGHYSFQLARQVFGQVTVREMH